MTLRKKDEKYDCADIERLAQRYVDGHLNPVEISLFEEHLEYCLPCDKKIEFELKLKEILRIKAREKFKKEDLDNKLKDIISQLH
ncbi:MAG TPA: zf-HC2 domain-containing protein [Calditrichaeota bacterium]|nr:zf-HC2 domain-containing protein [Calditrichota bacterium]